MGRDSARGVHGPGRAFDVFDAKADAIAAHDVEVVFIGQLQTNKVRSLVGLVDVWASVDRPKLVTELARRAPPRPAEPGSAGAGAV